MKRETLVFGIIGLIALSALFGCAGMEPSGAAATNVAGGIRLAWSPVSGATGYNIYRSTASGTLGDKVNRVLITGGAAFTDNGVQDGTTYYYTVKSADASGKEFGTAQISATAKTAPPRSMQISIDSGKQYTSSTSVALALFAIDASQCRYSNDRSAWSDWESYATSKAWQLSSGDGTKDVYYQCKDDIGNTAEPVSASIYLDTVPPTLTVSSPSEGGQYVGTFDVVFMVTDAVAASINCHGNLDDGQSDVGVVDAGKQYTIHAQTAAGQHRLYIECTDGMQTASKTISFTVVDKPSVSISIGDGSGYTETVSVMIDVTAAYASECRLSNDGSTWGTWSPYARTVPWRLTSGEGTKRVFAQCRSSNGQVSDTADDTIILDTSPPPYISVAINNGAKWTSSRVVTLGLYAFAADKCRYSNDGSYWSDWEGYMTRKSWTLSPGTGTKYVYYNCKKKTGEDIGTATASLQYSDVPPNPPTSMRVRINGGDSYTSSRTVSLSMGATGATECRLQEDDEGWQDWTDYVTSGHFYLSGGDGMKTLYYQCRNDYGTNTVHSTIYLLTSPPPAITDLTGSAIPDPPQVHLHWSRPVDRPLTYYIYRSTQSMGLITLIGTTTSTTYTDVNVMQGEGYSYSVKSTDEAGRQSAESNVASVQVGPPPNEPVGGDGTY